MEWMFYEAMESNILIIIQTSKMQVVARRYQRVTAFWVLCTARRGSLALTILYYNPQWIMCPGPYWVGRVVAEPSCGDGALLVSWSYHRDMP